MQAVKADFINFLRLGLMVAAFYFTLKFFPEPLRNRKN